MFPGKLNRPADGAKRPEATAARELEEESHGLIPAAASLAVLPSCPQWYCSSSKMVMYMMRYAGGHQLPDLLEQRLAGRAAWAGVGLWVHQLDQDAVMDMVLWCVCVCISVWSVPPPLSTQVQLHMTAFDTVGA